jgi:hypothetical protein
VTRVGATLLFALVLGGCRPDVSTVPRIGRAGGPARRAPGRNEPGGEARRCDDLPVQRPQVRRRGRLAALRSRGTKLRVLQRKGPRRRGGGAGQVPRPSRAVTVRVVGCPRAPSPQQLAELMLAYAAHILRDRDAAANPWVDRFALDAMAHRSWRAGQEISASDFAGESGTDPPARASDPRVRRGGAGASAPRGVYGSLRVGPLPAFVKAELEDSRPRPDPGASPGQSSSPTPPSPTTSPPPSLAQAPARRPHRGVPPAQRHGQAPEGRAARPPRVKPART